MRVKTSLLHLATLVLLAAGVARSMGAPRAESDMKRNVFIGLKDFSNFTKASGEKNELVLTSPEMPAPNNWDELVVSWNVPTNVYLKAEARAIFPDHTTKYFIMSKWSDNLALYPRESVTHQRDDDGTVSIDTLELKRHGGKVQVRITLGSPKGSDVSQLHFLGLSFCDSEAAVPTRAPNKAAWGKVVDIPQRWQGAYEGGGGWCSPTSLSMVLAYWSDKLHRPEIDHTVPETAHSIHDSELNGTGNWPFNTAYAGKYPGMRAYVTRLDDITELEDWIAAGISPITSVSSFINVKHKGGDEGHLIVCCGFTDTGDVVVNDPGGSTEKPARKVYERQHFIDCWKKSKNAVYLVYPENAAIPKNDYGHWDSGK